MAAESGEDQNYKAGGLKGTGAKRKSEGFKVAKKSLKGDGAREPCGDRAGERVSARACQKWPITRRTKYENFNAS